MKKFTAFLIVFLVLFSGCAFWRSGPEEGVRACTQEAKICPDGSSVGRTGPNCEFAPCPGSPPAADSEKKYIGHSADECSRIRFQCAPGTVYFSDENGCGCVAQPTSGSGECGFINGEQVNCPPGQVCAAMEGEAEPRCYPENPCAAVSCPAGTECVVMESWPAQIRCASPTQKPIDIPPPAPDQPKKGPPYGDDGVVHCTQEVMRCPDGSYVGRVPPRCAFAPCPGY